MGAETEEEEEGRFGGLGERKVDARGFQMGRFVRDDVCKGFFSVGVKKEMY